MHAFIFKLMMELDAHLVDKYLSENHKSTLALPQELSCHAGLVPDIKRY